jgi:hypothetical protein
MTQANLEIICGTIIVLAIYGFGAFALWIDAKSSKK